MLPVIRDIHKAGWHIKGSEKSCFKKSKKLLLLSLVFQIYLLTFSLSPF